MIKTYGLTHLALAAHNTERSFRFYQQVFGMVEVYRGEFVPGEPLFICDGCGRLHD